MDKAKELKIKTIFRRVLEEIKPSELEVKATIANVNMVMSRLKKIVPKKVELRVAGSIARGTNLKGDGDIDIFMLFGTNVSKEELIRLGLGYGRKLVDRKRHESYEIRYAEHPYIRLYLDNVGLKVDLVPAFKIDNVEDLATSVDRTPLHTDFINTHLTNKQRDEVRLLKYLLKAHNIYGAEVKTGGFSGYLCEILIYQFGSLQTLLETFSELKTPIVLSPKYKTCTYEESLVKRFGSSFIVVDPVDQNRNAGAGVSQEALSRFVLVSRRFLSNPTIDAFYSGKFSSAETSKLLHAFFKESCLRYFLIALKIPDKSVDVIWPQLRKVSSHISDYVSRFGFEIYLVTSWTNGKEGFILIVAPEQQLKVRLFKGPDVLKTRGSPGFIKKHSKSLGFVMRGSIIYSLDRNRYTDLKGVLNDIAKGRVIKKHKEIELKGSRLYVDEIPARYSEATYIELKKKISI